MDKDKTIDVIAVADSIIDSDPRVMRQITDYVHEFGSDNPIKLLHIIGCKDIWIRDFMPIVRHDGKFIKYRYAPDYLLKSAKQRKYITNFDDIKVQEVYPATAEPVPFNEYFGVTDNDFIDTDLVIDGGNVVQCVDKNGKNSVLMTIKVLYENSTKSQAAVISELEQIFAAEVILLPWDPDEEYGHTDGMVMPICPGQLLLNNYKECDIKFYHQIELALQNRFRLVSLEYGKVNEPLSWSHLNCLELENVILVPGAEIVSDEIALQLIREYLHKETSELKMRPIIQEGGALHCITWNYKLKQS